MKVKRIQPKLALAAGWLVLLALSSGCGYSLAGRGAFLPAHIKTIGIPAFDSMVPRSDLITELTEAVTSEFIARGGYQIVAGRTGVDAVLDGTITGWVETPIPFDDDGRATRSQLVITARVEMRDLHDQAVLYENPSFSHRADLELEGDDDQFLDPESEAVEEIAREFAKSLVASIVEGF